MQSKPEVKKPHQPAQKSTLESILERMRSTRTTEGTISGTIHNILSLHVEGETSRLPGYHSGINGKTEGLDYTTIRLMLIYVGFKGQEYNNLGNNSMPIQQECILK